LQDDPNSARAHASLALVYLYQGRKELTPLEARKALELDPNEREGFTMLASNVAEFYAVLGDKAKSLEWLDRAVRAGDERAEWFQRDPLLGDVQMEPRFRQIMDGIRNRREQQAKSNR